MVARWRNSWIAFPVMVVAAIVGIFLYGQMHEAYVEYRQISGLEANAVSALRIISTATLAYASRHGRYPKTLAEMGPPGDDLLDYSMSSGAILGYVLQYDPSDSGTKYHVLANPTTKQCREFFTDQTGILRAGINANAPELR